MCFVEDRRRPSSKKTKSVSASMPEASLEGARIYVSPNGTGLAFPTTTASSKLPSYLVLNPSDAPFTAPPPPNQYLPPAFSNTVTTNNLTTDLVDEVEKVHRMASRLDDIATSRRARDIDMMRDRGRGRYRDRSREREREREEYRSSDRDSIWLSREQSRKNAEEIEKLKQERDERNIKEMIAAAVQNQVQSQIQTQTRPSPLSSPPSSSSSSSRSGFRKPEPSHQQHYHHRRRHGSSSSSSSAALHDRDPHVHFRSRDPFSGRAMGFDFAPKVHVHLHRDSSSPRTAGAAVWVDEWGRDGERERERRRHSSVASITAGAARMIVEGLSRVGDFVDPRALGDREGYSRGLLGRNGRFRRGSGLVFEV